MTTSHQYDPNKHSVDGPGMVESTCFIGHEIGPLSDRMGLIDMSVLMSITLDLIVKCPLLASSILIRCLALSWHNYVLKML